MRIEYAIGASFRGDLSALDQTVAVCIRGRRIAAAEMCGKTGLIWVDGHETVLPAGVQERPVFSTDGSRFGYLVNGGGEALVVLDGDPQRRRDADYATDLRFSGDGRHHGLLQWRKVEHDRLWVEVDNRIFGPYGSAKMRDDGGLWGVVFEHMQSRYHFVVEVDDQDYAVVDGVQLGPYDGVICPVAMGGASRFAFSVLTDGRWHVNDTGNTGEGFDGIISGSLSVSDNGEHVAYASGRADERYLVLDGKIAETRRNGYSIPRLSPDATRLARIEFRCNGSPPNVRIDDDEAIRAPSDGKGIALDSFTWSPDSRAVGFVWKATSGFWVSAGRRLEGPYSAVSKCAGLQFSHDGRHCAYVATKGACEHLIVDGEATPIGIETVGDLLGLEWISSSHIRFAHFKPLEKTVVWGDAFR